MTFSFKYDYNTSIKIYVRCPFCEPKSFRHLSVPFKTILLQLSITFLLPILLRSRTIVSFRLNLNLNVEFPLILFSSARHVHHPVSQSSRTLRHKVQNMKSTITLADYCISYCTILTEMTRETGNGRSSVPPVCSLVCSVSIRPLMPAENLSREG